MSIVVARAVPASTWWPGRVGLVLLCLAAGGATMVLADRALRRLLPLAALLEMSLAFPDRAPSRLRVALRAGSPKRLLDIEHSDHLHAERDAHAVTVLALAAGLTVHDRATRGHSERVRAYAELIADELGMDEDDHDRLRWAALLHDIGKVTVPTATLNATHPLSELEWELLRRHPEKGAQLTAPLAAWLGQWARAVAEHHERFDGAGYPRGLAGEELSLAGRIVAVADSYDAMTTDRSYSKAMLPSAAREQLVTKAGTQFDPSVVRAFLNVGIGRIRRIIGPVALLAAAPVISAFPGLVRRARQSVSASAVALASVVTVVSLGGGVAPESSFREHSRTVPPAVASATAEHPAPVAATAPPSSRSSRSRQLRPAASLSSGDRSAGSGRGARPRGSTPPCQLRVNPMICAGAELRTAPSLLPASLTVHTEAAGVVSATYTATVPPGERQAP